MEARGLLPPGGSPNQPFSGAEFVGVMGRIEDFQRGDPAVKRAALLPGETETLDDATAPSQQHQPEMTQALLLSLANSAAWWQAPPATAPTATDVPTKDRPLKL